LRKAAGRVVTIEDSLAGHGILDGMVNEPAFDAFPVRL